MKLMPMWVVIAFCLINTAQAESFQLEVSGSEPLYQTSLPKAVYQHSRSPALQDLTITNANGEQVPYALLTYSASHPQTTTTQDTKPLSVFPIKESSLSKPDALSIQIAQGTNHTSVDITSNSAITPEKTVYLVDAGKKHPPLKTLSVEWQGSEGVLLVLDVLASDDLKNWSNVGHGVLLKTSAEGHGILQNSINLDSATEARYLQIRVVDHPVLKITRMNAEYSSVQPLTPQMHWQDAQFIQREKDDKKGIVNLDFESLGRYPASYLQVKLPQNNTITIATIFVRQRNDLPWQQVTTTSLYRTEKAGKSYTTPDTVINATTARYWRLQFNQSSGGIGAENPQLSLGWLPHTVVWNARGQAPFSLQVGANQKFANSVGIDSLIPDYKVEKILLLPKASLATQVSPNANSNNTPPEHASNAWAVPTDYKSGLLWGVLLLGVLLLVGMAYSLLKAEKKS